MPVTDDDLTRVAAFLAAEERKKRGATAPVLDRIFTNRPAGIEASTMSQTGASKALHGDEDRSALEAAGYRYLPQDDFDKVRENWAPTSLPPPGKLPFYSNTPTHPAPPGYSNALPKPQVDQGMADAMSSAATAARQQKGPVQPPAKKTAGAQRRQRSSLAVSSTSEGVQPTLRPFESMAHMGPEDAERRLQGLPEGVARTMRQRWGIGDAQADANRRSLAVELASAGNQIASGITGTKYDDNAWDGQRGAARQPVEDYQQQAGEARAQSEADRRAAADERAIREAEREAALELERFQYGKDRDKAADTLARDKMAADDAYRKEDLKQRGLDRAEARADRKDHRASDILMKALLQDDKEAERKRREGERDLQRLGEATAKAPYGEFQSALQEIDSLMPGIAYGQAPKEAPVGVGDRIARAIPFGAGEWAMSEEGKRYTTAIANLRDLVSRMRSGAVLNLGEERHYLNLLGDRALSDPSTAAAGINAVRQGVAQKLRNAQAGYAKTGALDEYEQTGATTYRAPIFGAPPARPTGRKVTRPDGSVWQELDNGEAEMVSPPTRR